MEENTSRECPKCGNRESNELQGSNPDEPIKLVCSKCGTTIKKFSKE